MTTRTTFAGAGTTTVMPDSAVALASPMPAVDGANQDTQISCTGLTTWVAFGAGVVASPGAPGVIAVQPGYPVLLTNNAATLTACATNANVVGGVQASVAAAATSFSALAFQRGGSLTITRGTASPSNVF